MQIVQTVGGFSLGGADIVRRAMGKKKIEEMQKYNKEFSEGAQNQGLDYQKASELFDLIEKFAGYGFNKSHSAAYAMVTFQTAWLKTYYPQEFMAALLTSEKDNTDKVVKYIDEAKRMKISLGAPDINHSQLEFSAITKDDADQILFGLGAIKGVGEAAVESILEARSEGEFADIKDFVNRIEPQKVNKKVIECIIKAGGLDRFGYSRRALLEQVEILVEAAKQGSTLKKESQFSLFGDDEEVTTVDFSIKNYDEYDLKAILDFEKETLGFYVSGHPLDNFRSEIDAINYTLSSEIENIADGSTAIFIGKVEEITKKMSKKGSMFGLVNLMDFHGNIEVMLFSDKIEQLEAMDMDEPIAFKVKVTHTEMFTRISVMKILTLAEAKKEAKKVETKIVENLPPPEPLNLRIRLSDDLSALEQLYVIVRRHPGRRPIKLTVVSKLVDIVIDSAIRVDEKVLEDLAGLEEVDVI